MKKNKFLLIVNFLLLLILLLFCLLAAYLSIAPILKFADASYKIIEYLIISMVGIIVYIFLLAAIQVWHHKGKKDHHHHYHRLYEDIQEALDKIARGDFIISLDMDRYHYNHLNELADKVNVMAQELSSMETMRQDFVSNVSHEIQSPLTSIRGFITLLRNENLSKEEYLHYIDIIETESLRLSKLSDNLLKLTALDSDYVLFQPKPYLLNKQLKDVILMLEPQWSAKNIDLSIIDEAAEVIADEELFSQVWINLLHNSIKFTPENGKITVSVCKGEQEVTVTVEDNGIGMTTEALAHIYERFYMADKSRSRKAGGSGLGLSIVKRIVEIHHGSIDVKSQLGKGTIFGVSIPVKNIK